MLSAMANRSDLHSQLTAIVQTMAKSVLSQVCKVVEEDSAELRLELSRLLVVNSTLADKVNSLESELTNVRKTNQPQFRQSQRSIGVQTVSTTDGDACVSTSPTIAGIFGKDWCMNLWKDGEPYSQDNVPESPQSSYK
ncbi:uncharacterized protein isoform X3 [Takifugu rubripes]|nr:uncharacterized protein LOC105416463 isoform X3 [Takifugu rubripes]